MNNISTILTNVLLQLISFVGFVYLFGFIISIINKLFYNVTGNSRAAVYSTAFIGTPIHELSHALMCIVFGHKITEIKLFQINSDDGTLGYVKHSSNPRNIYHQIGQYFIGVAPIFVGSFVLYFAMKYFLLDTYYDVNSLFIKLNSAGGGALGWVGHIGDAFVFLIKSILGNAFQSLYGWLFILISMCIALHMNLSTADIKSSVAALPLLAIILAAVNLILGFVSTSAYSAFIGFMNSAGIFVGLMLLLSLILSLFCIVIAYAVRWIMSLIKR